MGVGWAIHWRTRSSGPITPHLLAQGVLSEEYTVLSADIFLREVLAAVYGIKLFHLTNHSVHCDISERRCRLYASLINIFSIQGRSGIVCIM